MRTARGPATTTPAHLTPELAVVWSALRLATDAAGGRAVPMAEVLGPLRAIDPRMAGQLLRVELLLEALAVDPRTGVAVDLALGGRAPRYGL